MSETRRKLYIHTHTQIGRCLIFLLIICCIMPNKLYGAIGLTKLASEKTTLGTGIQQSANLTIKTETKQTVNKEHRFI